jgi:hypothetical protein
MSEIINWPALKKNEAVTLYVTLADPTNADIRVTNPPLAAGDARVSGDGGTFTNLATLPVVAPAGDVGVRIVLSASEMNFDNVLVVLADQTGPEVWSALTISIHTYAVDQDDLVRSTVPANALDVAATGEAGVDLSNIKQATGSTTLTNITVPTVTTLTGHTPQTGDSYARLGAPAGASISADVAAIKSDTGTVLTKVNTLHDTRIPDTISLANINAEVDNALNTAIPGSPTTDSVNERIRTMDIAMEAGGSYDLPQIKSQVNTLKTDAQDGGRVDLQIDDIQLRIASTGAKIDLTQTISEGQSARTIGGSLEASEATERNKVHDDGVGGSRIVYRSNGSTPLITRNHTANELAP